MKKVILEFDTSPENGGTEGLVMALHGASYKAILEDLLEMLRSKRKYADKTLISIEEVETFIRDNMP